MAFNYGPPPGAYGQVQPSYGQNPPGMNMGPPPGFAPAPGMDQPPTMMQNPSPGGVGGFQPPPNMPNFDMNAPVIRLGLQNQASTADRAVGRGPQDGRAGHGESQGGRSRAGLGAERGGSGRDVERQREQVRESMMALQPPTREEVARTIFIGGLGENSPDDEAIQTLLRCAGKLRRWTRAEDAQGKKCKFGFAEYEDVESLEAANEVYEDVEVPLFRNGGTMKDADGQVKKSKFLVVVDEQSKTYIEEWKGRRKEDPDARQFRIDGCKEEVRLTLSSLANVGGLETNGTIHAVDGDGDAQMSNETEKVAAEEIPIIDVPLSLEDELADIPAEMRPTVAAEIKAFRDRSNRRDLERLQQEERLEKEERQRAGGSRINRLASPPTGPAGSTNGIPLGPRGVLGAPSGPKGYRGNPSDYANGVSFVGENGEKDSTDESGDESDETLERRRVEKRKSNKEGKYQEYERRLRNRERQRANAFERERVREEAVKRDSDRHQESAARRLKEWDDEKEAKLGREEYYHDHSQWLRRRAQFREREERDDERDRALEERERAEERHKAAADTFLDQAAADLADAQQPRQAASGLGNFKISLGSAAAKSRATIAEAVPIRRRGAEVEGLLEDEEDAVVTGRKRLQLKQLTDTSTVPTNGSDLTDQEREEARRTLIGEIPNDTTELFAHPIQWGYLTAGIFKKEIRPFVEKKVVEYLGVQEDLLVDAVMESLKERKEAAELVKELEDALEDESEVLVKKVWRLLVFWAECEARGLSG